MKAIGFGHRGNNIAHDLRARHDSDIERADFETVLRWSSEVRQKMLG
jgi:hypothetical protein